MFSDLSEGGRVVAVLEPAALAAREVHREHVHPKRRALLFEDLMCRARLI